jgi:CubicO group peptidase (beta-lactamase class C family)
MPKEPLETALRLLWLLCLTAIAPLFGQTLQVAPSIQLQYDTIPGQAYRLESSTDLQQWAPWSPIRLGDGKPVFEMVPAGDSSRSFRISTNQVRDLSSLLGPIRLTNGVPALGCVVLRSNRIVGIGAVGFRKAGVTSAPVTVNDRWHHGSLTKSMTATLAAMIVADGKIRWDSTLAEVFPEFASTMHPSWRGTTLQWLTVNRGGAPTDLSVGGIWSQLWNFGRTPREGRRLLLEKLTVLPPASTPGTRYEYSNAGFALAGHMLEQVTGTAWEELMTTRLFRPLGMTSAGFGVPATPRYLDEPWGHQLASGNTTPIEPGTSADNPPAIGPAGTAHCSLADLARYVAFHIEGNRYGTPGLARDSFLKLHTPIANNSNYAHGWIAVDRAWAGNGKALTHTGSNVQWYSAIWMAPAREFAVIAVSNIASSSGTNPGANATTQVVSRMITEFLGN